MPNWSKTNFDAVRDLSPPDVPMQWRFAEVIELGTWDALRVAPAVIRSFEAGPGGMDVICIGGRKPEGRDSERFPDPWD